MSIPVAMPRVVVAGIGSNSGKTTFSLGLVTALQQRGRVVQTFKTGSDFIDSAYLAHASRRPCRTLDSWVLGTTGTRHALARGVRDADCAVVEGAGGLFDSHGVNVARDASRFPGSTAEVASVTGSPVILILDVAAMRETTAAIALGIRQLDPTLTIAGVVLNNCDTQRRRGAIEDAIWELATLPVLGAIPHSAQLHIPEAHHQLAPLVDNPAIDRALHDIADVVERHCDMNLIERLMGTAAHLSGDSATTHGHGGRGVRIGVAFDDAFAYYYPENLELLEDAGAEIVAISPLEDHSVPRDLDAVYLGGGIVETYLEHLARNQQFMESLRRLHGHGVPVYAEGGGALYVARSVETHDGRSHAMSGLLDVDLRLHPERGRDRFREVHLVGSSMLGTSGLRLRGHEFHVVSQRGGARHDHAYSVHDSDGEPLGCEGWTAPNLLVSTVHLHFGQNPAMARRFVEAAQTRTLHHPLQPA